MARTPQEASPSASTVSGVVAHRLFRYAAERGHDARALAARFALDLEALADIDARIGADTAQSLWRELPVLLDDDNLGLHLAQYLGDEGVLLPALMLASAETLGEGLHRGLEVQRALAEGSVWRFDRTEGTRHWYVYDIADPRAAAPRQVLDLGFGLLILVARRVVHEDVAPAELRFRDPPPKDRSEQEALFRCPLYYGQPRDELAIEESALRLPVRTANPSLMSHLTSHGRKQVQALAPTEALTGRVQQLLRADVSRAPAVEDLAGELAMSPRTLQRRLQAEGTSLQELYDRVRYERACELLRDRSLGVRAVALTLGFSEQAAFHRAFARWSGMAPGRWREAHGVRPPQRGPEGLG